MDTRSKIVTREEACHRLGARPAHWVSGTFDPLLAEHVRRLRTRVIEGHALVVEITNPEKPLLSQRARAELAAAISFVDYVVMTDTIADADLTDKFSDHVRERHRAEGKL